VNYHLHKIKLHVQDHTNKDNMVVMSEHALLLCTITASLVAHPTQPAAVILRPQQHCRV